MVKRFIIKILTLAFTLNTQAQLPKEGSIYKTILTKDSLLFTIGFNKCNLQQFEDALSPSFEFFHDKSGDTNKQNFLKNLKNGLCQSPETYQSRRELLPESIEIYPLYNNNVLYGAVQNGSHRFYETIAQGRETLVGLAKFTHLWLLENGIWKLSKSLSFDHQEATTLTPENPIFENDIAIEQWLKELHIPTLGIGIINNGKLQQIKIFGELQTGITAPYNTIFNVASLTKPITAIVTLKLISLGKWNLDDPLYKYWIDPDIAKSPYLKLFTTRHILSHQSGFPNWRFNSKNGKLHFDFPPGTQYQYSGEGFEYLRKALERKFRKSLNQLATELVFNPLKMSDTKYFWDKKTDSTRFATGYDPKGQPYQTIKNNTTNAADDLLTTITDYGTFMTSLLKQEGLTEAIYKSIVSPQVVVKKDKHFGLGFVIYDLGNSRYALSHGGADEGCQTLMILLPQSGKGILIFTNVDDGYKVYEKLLTHYLGSDGSKIIAIEAK